MNAWDTLLQRATERNILPDPLLRTPEPATGHPWPLVLLSFFGALLATLPLTLLILLLQGLVFAPYVIGPFCIGVASLILVRRKVPLFVEHLALVALMLGLGLLSFGLIHDLQRTGSVWCMLISLSLALVISAHWVRVLLGALACGFLCGSLTLLPKYFSDVLPLLIWGLALWAQRSILLSGHARLAIALENIFTGWVMLQLYLYVLPPDIDFLTGVIFGDGNTHAEVASKASSAASRGIAHLVNVQSILPVVLVSVAGFWGVIRSAALRTPAGIGLLATLAVLSLVMPSLGYILLLGIVLLLTHRPIQAAAAVLAAAWVIGDFYFALDLPLARKAQILILAGIALGLLAWLGLRRESETADRGQRQSRVAPLLILASAVVTLVVVNTGIWQKESLIAEGRTIYIRLSPVDPRSLMQGDYMALNFDIPLEARLDLGEPSELQHALGVARVDNRGVASVERVADGQAIGSSEILIELIPKNGRWIVVSDAWFFKEGDGERWSRARYGEFRVMPDGKASLVGMTDEQLVPIKK